MERRQLLSFLFGCLIAVAGMLLIWWWLVEPIQSNRRWYDRIRADIETLAHKRPPELNKGQWQFILGWTIQLHANCGTYPHVIDPDWPERFAADFERRLAGPITLVPVYRVAGWSD